MKSTPIWDTRETLYRTLESCDAIYIKGHRDGGSMKTKEELQNAIAETKLLVEEHKTQIRLLSEKTDLLQRELNELNQDESTQALLNSISNVTLVNSTYSEFNHR